MKDKEQKNLLFVTLPGAYLCGLVNLIIRYRLMEAVIYSNWQIIIRFYLKIREEH